MDQGTLPVNDNSPAGPKRNEPVIRRLMVVLNAILWITISLAVLIQVLYFLYVFVVNPNFQLPWRIRDSFLLFSFVGNIAVVILTASSIIVLKFMGKRIDRYDELIDNAMKDFEGMKEKFNKIENDVEILTPGINRLSEFYLNNKKEIHKSVEFLEDLAPLIPIIEKQYGHKLKRIKDMPENEKEFLLEELKDELLDRDIVEEQHGKRSR